MRVKNLLITGPPGCGKTTLVRKVAQGLTGVPIAGFLTTELREGGERAGFSLVSCGGGRGILSHVRFPGPPRVGRYGVDLPGFEAFLDGIPFTAPGTRLILIDEIGKMECYSPRFRALVTRCLDGPIPFLATIALRGDRFIEGIKIRPDVELVTMTRENRDRMTAELVQRVREMIAGRDWE
jgi:nucleoside-triphosphatase